ncbi:GNAT family N-acetyltransferase [Aliiglaciecola sp. CAU 1673]|uniref:GNAT family N-acetyltransferase n=1 Tax=Aliiglaciecola sp. CAU 1673 TaxID=3032595 RepID=UPI0023DC865C|nr:GNAT family N-acetyltransferase [Aliiglaciecola sp. CAU 1673]
MMESYKGQYLLTDDKNRLDLDAIHQALSNSYWSPGIPKSLVAKAIQHSMCFGVFFEGKQVGFARMITDRASFAYLADVYVLQEHSGQGVGKALMDFLLGHPELQGLRRIMLCTRDAHGLYSQFGFSEVPNPEIMMQIHSPNIYQTGSPA